MVYMWQEERGKAYYKFQTENKHAAQKMKRRNKFVLSGAGLNCDFWIFRVKFARPDIAKKALKTITGGKVEYAQREDVFYSRIDMSKYKTKAA